MDYLPPAERWPRHPRPMAAAAIEEARAAGWWFKPASGHAFGRLRCKQQGEGCVVPVYSTSGPADGSDTARVILSAVRKCPHAGDTTDLGFPDPAVAARGQLAELDRILGAAEALLVAESSELETERLIEGLGSESPDGLDHDTVFDELQTESAKALARGLAYVTDTGLEDPWPPAEGAAELLAIATARLKTVAQIVAAANDRELADEADRATARAQQLSSRSKNRRY